jgi:hypothetical protein
VPARESHSIFSGEKLSESENDGASPSAEEDCCSVLKVLISELKAEMHFRGDGRSIVLFAVDDATLKLGSACVPASTAIAVDAITHIVRSVHLTTTLALLQLILES